MSYLYVGSVPVPFGKGITCERVLGARNKRVFEEAPGMPKLTIMHGGESCGAVAVSYVAVDTLPPYVSRHFLWVAQCAEHAADLQKLHRRTYRGTPPAGYFGYDPSFLEDEPQGDTK